jgi:hypothetical protein
MIPQLDLIVKGHQANFRRASELCLTANSSLDLE